MLQFVTMAVVIRRRSKGKVTRRVLGKVYGTKKKGKRIITGGRSGGGSVFRSGGGAGATPTTGAGRVTTPTTPQPKTTAADIQKSLFQRQGYKVTETPSRLILERKGESPLAVGKRTGVQVRGATVQRVSTFREGTPRESARLIQPGRTITIGDERPKFVGSIREDQSMRGALEEPIMDRPLSPFQKVRGAFESGLQRRQRSLQSFGAWEAQRTRLGLPETRAVRAARASAAVSQTVLGGVGLVGKVVFRPVETAIGIGKITGSTLGTIGAQGKLLTGFSPKQFKRTGVELVGVSKPARDVGKEVAIGFATQPLLTTGSLLTTPLIFGGLSRGVSASFKGVGKFVSKGQFKPRPGQIGGTFLGKNAMQAVRSKPGVTLTTKGAFIEMKAQRINVGTAAGSPVSRALISPGQKGLPSTSQLKLLYKGGQQKFSAGDIARSVLGKQKKMVSTSRQLTYTGTTPGKSLFQLHLKQQAPLTGRMLPRRIAPAQKTVLPKLIQKPLGGTGQFYSRTPLYLGKSRISDITQSVFSMRDVYTPKTLTGAVKGMFRSKRAGTGGVGISQYKQGATMSVHTGQLLQQPLLKRAALAQTVVPRFKTVFRPTASTIGLGTFARTGSDIISKPRVGQRSRRRVRLVPIISTLPASGVRSSFKSDVGIKPTITPIIDTGIRGKQGQGTRSRIITGIIPDLIVPPIPPAPPRPPTLRPPTTPPRPPRKPPILLKDSSFRRRKKKKGRGDTAFFRPFKYTASIVPSQFNIKGTRPKVLTGLGRRPLL